ncbi:hypothetical protein BCV69DRAFT_50634 [Microstroma glucosiphilum]|uniref:Uncharacterized protein n=1 Tax=Pseudomicrostroma glucosiphilum TaxID=1684307 RepID=A0A316U1R1_9BASI|nr:hypothetical protein BCV69DRAFT_50634 [Pseudomicrostroma glucosiphilum]PWN19312.1 hypothetical protein BCV69DRAFT_50634 [Pseudomicrostroma glucosiphilum]
MKCGEVTNISKRLAEKDGANRALEVRYEDLLIANAELQKAKEDLERCLGAAEGREVQLREQLEQSTDVLGRRQSELKAAQEEAAGISNKLSEANAQLDLAAQAAKAAEQRQQEMIAVRDEIALEIERLQKEKHAVESRLQDATDSLRICQKGAEQTTKLSEERAVRVDELKAECRELRQTEERLKKQLNHQHEMESALAAEKARSGTLAQSIDSLKGRLGEISSDKAAAEATVVQLRSQLETLQRRCEELTDDYEGAQDGNRTATESIRRLRNDLEAAEKRVAQGATDLADLNEKYSEVIEIVENNKADLEDAHRVISDLEGKITEIEEQESGTAHTLQNALQNQEDLEATLASERKDRLEEITALREKTNGLEKDILSVKQEKEKLLTQVKTLEDVQAKSVEKENTVMERARRGLLTRAEVELCNYSAALQRDQNQREMCKKDNEIKRLEFERRGLEAKIFQAHAARSQNPQTSTRRTLSVLMESSSSSGLSDAGSSPDRSGPGEASTSTEEASANSHAAAPAPAAPITRRSSRFSTRATMASTGATGSGRQPRESIAPDSLGAAVDESPSTDCD